MKNTTMQLVQRQLPGPYVNIEYTLQWVMPDGTVRIPEETTRKFSHVGIFRAAGKLYSSRSQLCARQTDADGTRFLDIYDREVFACRERFPCFDSYDYLYEHRYYRWFFIRHMDTLTCVYCEDERPGVQVTEDIRFLRENCWKAIREAGWQQD